MSLSSSMTVVVPRVPAPPLLAMGLDRFSERDHWDYSNGCEESARVLGQYGVQRAEFRAEFRT
jgi:hypothetical protein